MTVPVTAMMMVMVMRWQSRSMTKRGGGDSSGSRMGGNESEIW
jgi:hypothetical protein